MLEDSNKIICSAMLQLVNNNSYYYKVNWHYWDNTEEEAEYASYNHTGIIQYIVSKVSSLGKGTDLFLLTNDKILSTIILSLVYLDKTYTARKAAMLLSANRDEADKLLSFIRAKENSLAVQFVS